MPSTKTPMWINFFGVVFLIIGIYGLGRTAVNMLMFDRYPQGSVLPITFSSIYGPREEDCDLNFPYLAPPPESGIQLSPEEIKQQTDKQRQSCLTQARESRKQAQVNDISQSLLFLSLGVGILGSRKFLFS